MPFHLLDMPQHRLQARSQILRRALILVEVIILNWERNYLDALWLPREDDSLRYRQSRILIVCHGQGEHPIHNRRLQRPGDQGKAYLIESAFADSGSYSIRDWIVPEDFQPIKWQGSLHCRPGRADRAKLHRARPPRKSPYFKLGYMRWTCMQPNNSIPWRVRLNKR